MFLIKVYGANHDDIQACILLLNASRFWEAPLVGASVKERGGNLLQNTGLMLYSLSFKLEMECKGSF